MAKERYDAVIIAGMRFDHVNACTHRMVGIAKLFSSCCENVYLLGVGESSNQGQYDRYEYQTIVYPRSFSQWISFTLSAKKYLSYLKAHKNIKYVIVNGSIPSLPTMAIARYCKKHGIHFIFDIGEWYTKGDDRFIRGLVKDLDTFIKMHHICKKYNNYIVASSYLKRHCGDHKNILLLPTIVTNRLPIFRDRHFNGELHLSFVGVLEKNNLKENLSPLLEAVELYNQLDNMRIHLDVIGSEGESSSHITFYGKKPYEDCIRMIVNSDFTVIPRDKTRKNESGFPTKLSESFLYGVPVISTDTGDIKQYIIEGVNGYLLPLNTVQCYLDCFKTIEASISEDPRFIDDFEKRVMEHNNLQTELFSDSFGLFIELL